MINVVCGIRSTGRICTDLATELEAQGHDVKIAYGREEVPEQFQKYAVRIGTDFDVLTHGIRARIIDGAGFGSKHATDKFIEWVKQYDPDIIHLHNLHGYYINIEVLFRYLKTCGKKIIWTLHDCWAFTGHSAYCDAVGCKRWARQCYDCSLKKEYPVAWIDCSKNNWIKKKNILSGVAEMTIITPSKWLATMVRKSFLKHYPVRIINNGIDTKQFYPQKSEFREKWGIKDSFLILGVSTSWDEMKGYSDYIKLAKILGGEYKVILVGLSKKQLNKLPHEILGIEKTSSIKELAEIYSAVDLYVNLSYCENYPTVNIEAMACGTPVLTYDTGGSPEIVDKYGGVVVKKGNINAVANACKRIKSNPIKVNFEIKENDKNAVIEKYMKVLKPNYDNLYSKVQ